MQNQEEQNVNNDMFPVSRSRKSGDYSNLFPQRNTNVTKELIVRRTIDNWHKMIDPDKLLRSMLRKWWLLSLMFIIVTVTSYFSIALFHSFPSKYSATATLLYQKNSQQRLDTMSIHTVKEMIIMYRNCQGVKTLLNLDMSIDELIESITVSVGRNSNLIELKAISETPKMAKEIANTLAEVAFDNNKTFYERKAKNLLDNYADQIGKARKKASPIQQEFVAFKQKNNILDIDLSKRQIIDSASRLNNAGQDLKRLLISQQAEVSYLEGLVNKLPKKISKKQVNSDILDRQLSTMELRLSQLSEEYQENNPKLVKLREVIGRLKARIKNSNSTADKGSLVDNPKIQEFSEKIREKLASIAVTKQKQQEVNEQINLQMQKLVLFPRLQQEFAKLEIKKNALEVSISNLEELHKNATIDFVRPKTDFEIYELASNTELNPDYIRLIISFAVGVCCTTICFVVVVIKYFLNIKVSTLKEVELNYTPPCLAVIPDFQDKDLEDLTSPFRNHIESLAEKISICTRNEATLSIAICSALSNSSKSVIAYELARFYARLGLKTVYLDFDCGPDGVFDRTHDIEDIISHQDMTDRLLEEQGTFEKLKLNQHANMHDCLKSLACNKFFERVKEKNDVVIIDAPGILEGLHSCDIINMADHQIFSIASNSMKRNTIDDALIKLQELRIYPAGIILNSVARH